MLLCLSPHLDDAVFSVGALLAARAPAPVTVATVFTRSVPDPTGFALSCQTDKGYGPEVDYMALRRTEDREACAIVGAAVEHWGFEEAPHRGYATPSALFAGVRAGDEVWRGVAAALREYLARHTVAEVLYPIGVGDHVDHLQVIAAVDAVRGEFGGVRWYRWYDQPYAARYPEAVPELRGAQPLDAVQSAVAAPGVIEWVEDGEPLSRKLRACAAYRSQVGYQFYGAFGAERPAGADVAARAGEVLGRREWVRAAPVRIGEGKGSPQ